jgi:NAD(P)H-hydrate epimerase
MQRAGQAAFEALLAQWPDTRTILCFCGSGNNGGDGYVIAALAKQQSLNILAVAVGKTENLQGDARLAFALATATDVVVEPYDTLQSDLLESFPGPAVIVDAMLGTGLTGDVRGNYAKAIAWINKAGLPVLAADIPSGLCSDTGKVLGSAVQADLTVTFIGRKLGQILGAGPSTCGTLVFSDLDVPPAIYDRVKPAAEYAE